MLGTRSSLKSWCGMSEVVWFKYAVEIAVWLPQAFSLSNGYVSGEAVVRWIIKSEKLQRSDWRGLCHGKFFNKLTGLGIPETCCDG